MGHDHDSPSQLVWLRQDKKLVKSAFVTLEDEGRIFTLVGEMSEIGRVD